MLGFAAALLSPTYGELATHNRDIAIKKPAKAGFFYG